MKKYTQIMIIVIMVFITGLTLSIISSYKVYNLESDIAQDELQSNIQEFRQRFVQNFTQFEYSAQLYQNELSNNLTRKLEILTGLKEYILNTEDITWEDYHGYISPTLEEHEGVAAVFWTPVVHNEALDRFSQMAEDDGPQDFTLQYDIEDIPGDQSWPIYFVSPLKSNQEWVGQNIETNPVFTDNFNENIEKESPWLSDPFSSDESNSDNVFIALNVNINSNSFKATDEETDLYNSGILTMIIDVSSLVSLITENIEAEPIELFLYSSEGQRIATYGDINENILEESQSYENIEEIFTGTLYLDRRIEVPTTGQSWNLVFRPAEPIEVSIPKSFKEMRAAWVSMFFGILLSLGVSLLTYFIANEIMTRRISEKNQRKLAQYDQLTGLLNRRSLSEQLEIIWKYPSNTVRVLSILMIDLDHFKQVNDTYGHSIGDIVLRKLSDILQKMSRHNDIISRVGGEEFCLVLPNTGQTEAYEAAERIRKEVESQQFEADGNVLQITCSIGVAYATEEDESPDSIIKRADSALYVAKNEGRNRVSLI